MVTGGGAEQQVGVQVPEFGVDECSWLWLQVGEVDVGSETESGRTDRSSEAALSGSLKPAGRGRRVVGRSVPGLSHSAPYRRVLTFLIDRRARAHETRLSESVVADHRTG